MKFTVSLVYCLLVMANFIEAISQRITSNNLTYSNQIEGFWGKPTSTVDWCEENYVFSEFIAEFFNTISSLAMVACGALGMYFHSNMEKRFILTFFSICIVGIGSAAFHGTLLFSLQMLDELPMIYSALTMTYIIIEQKNKRAKYPYLPLILLLHGFLTTLMVASPAFFPDYASPLLQFVLFHVSFAILEINLLVNSVQMYMQEKHELYLYGLVLWFIGIACWILDYFGCEAIWEGEDGLRKKFMWLQLTESLVITIPNPQFHSWWHVCASSGLYVLSVVVALNRTRILGQNAKISYYAGLIPYVEIIKREKSEDVKRLNGGKIWKNNLEIKDDFSSNNFISSSKNSSAHGLRNRDFRREDKDTK